MTRLRAAPPHLLFMILWVEPRPTVREVLPDGYQARGAEGTPDFEIHAVGPSRFQVRVRLPQPFKLAYHNGTGREEVIAERIATDDVEYTAVAVVSACGVTRLEISGLDGLWR